MKRRFLRIETARLAAKWHVLATLSAGVLFGGGCSTLFDSVLTGGLDFLTGQVTSGLTQALPLDRLIAGLIQDAFAPR